MEPPDFFDCRVAIFGLGLMGGSLALALRGHCQKIFGVDSDPDTLNLAQQLSIVDRVASTPTEIFPESDLIVLAAPVGAIMAIIQALPDLHPGSPVVLDLGSTKDQVCQAYSSLPPRFDPIGGHPMCGKEKLGLRNADPRIFQGAPFALTPLARTSMSGRMLVEQIVKLVGAIPIWLDAAVHDHWVATTSHIPYLLSIALVLATPEEASPLIGPGFRSASRLAATPNSMMMDVLKTNKENILKAAQVFKEYLAFVENSIQEDDYEKLEAILSRASIIYQQLTGITHSEVAK